MANIKAFDEVIAKIAELSPNDTRKLFNNNYVNLERIFNNLMAGDIPLMSINNTKLTKLNVNSSYNESVIARINQKDKERQVINNTHISDVITMYNEQLKCKNVESVKKNDLIIINDKACKVINIRRSIGRNVRYKITGKHIFDDKTYQNKNTLCFGYCVYEVIPTISRYTMIDITNDEAILIDENGNKSRIKLLDKHGIIAKEWNNIFENINYSIIILVISALGKRKIMDYAIVGNDNC